MDEIEPIKLPIDGTLDLHAFRPADIKFLIPEYLEECRKMGILHVRIVHGKGTGTLRRTVHAALERIDTVVSFRLGDERSGSWGATLVTLQAAEQPAMARPDPVQPPDDGPAA
jgi:DNA-nicking Smr family endonuclease